MSSQPTKENPSMKPTHHSGSFSRKKSGGLFAAALLASSLATSFAGEMMMKADTTPVPQPPPKSNPLSFFDGVLTFDVQERVRWEARDNNFDFNSAFDAVTDDSWFLNRFRIGLMIKPTSWFKIYAQAQDSREIDSDRADIPGVLGAEGDDNFDLRQGYFEFGDVKEFPLTLKLGRQILSYGDERLIGAFDWNNIGRTFDAAKLRWEEKKWSLDAFASTVVVPTGNEYNQSDFYNGIETGRHQVFSGLYFSTTALSFQTTDLYALYLHEDTGPRYQPAARGDTGFATFGLRMKSKPGAFAHTPPPPDGKTMTDGKSMPAPPLPKKPVGLDYSTEMAFQTGKVRGLDLTSFAINAGLGYTFDVAWLPRVGIEYNYASGDRNPTDGEIETFQNLFPTNHKFYGIMDLTAWQNMQQAVVAFQVQPLKTVTVQLDYRAFFIASTDDVWYRANGVTPVRPLTPAAREAGKYEGSQVEIIATWNVTKWFQLQGGYAHFFTGDYLNDTGPSGDADFGYLQATFSF